MLITFRQTFNHLDLVLCHDFEDNEAVIKNDTQRQEVRQ